MDEKEIKKLENNRKQAINEAETAYREILPALMDLDFNNMNSTWEASKQINRFASVLSNVIKANSAILHAASEYARNKKRRLS